MAQPVFFGGLQGFQDGFRWQAVVLLEVNHNKEASILKILVTGGTGFRRARGRPLKGDPQGEANLLSPHFARCVEESRAFLKALFALPADIVPDEQAKTLTIQFHAMATPRSNRALKELCEIMNAEKCHFPQTPLQMIFKTPSVASEIGPCPEL